MPRAAEPAAAAPARLTQVATLTVAAASGLVSARQSLWLIADDGLSLQQLGQNGSLHGEHALFPGRTALPLEAKARKKAKPDLEALCVLPDGRLLALGSGSRRSRCEGSLFDPELGSARVIDLAPLYGALEQDLPELNIEGACVLGSTLVLAHRGNSGAAVDALVLLELPQVLADLVDGRLTAAPRRGLVQLALGALDGVRLTLTDLASDPQGRLWYSAAAEATDDRYDDGACAGSVIGVFDGMLTVMQQWRLPGRLKIEGLTCVDAAAADRWLVVADADDASSLAPLLQLQL